MLSLWESAECLWSAYSGPGTFLVPGALRGAEQIMPCPRETCSLVRDQHFSWILNQTEEWSPLRSQRSNSFTRLPSSDQIQWCAHVRPAHVVTPRSTQKAVSVGVLPPRGQQEYCQPEMAWALRRLWGLLAENSQGVQIVSSTSRDRQASPAALGICPSCAGCGGSRDKSYAAATGVLITPQEPMALLITQEFF